MRLKIAIFMLLAMMLLLIPFMLVFAGANEPVNIDTKSHQVKKPLTSPATSYDFVWSGILNHGLLKHSVTLYVDGQGSVLTTGTKNPVKIGLGGTLIGWSLMGKPSGSITVDVYRATNGNGLPTTSIVGAGTKPALASGVENSSTTFTGWTSTALNANDNLALNLSGISTTTYVALTLYFVE